jgi:hypothetical protein
MDTLIAVINDAMSIISTMGRPDVSEILQKRVNKIMGWTD